MNSNTFIKLPIFLIELIWFIKTSRERHFTFSVNLQCIFRIASQQNSLLATFFMLHLKCISGAYVGGREPQLWIDSSSFKCEYTAKELLLTSVFFIIVCVTLLELSSDWRLLILAVGSYFLNLPIFLRLLSKPNPVSTSSWAVPHGCITAASDPDRTINSNYSLNYLTLSNFWCLAKRTLPCSPPST